MQDKHAEPLCVASLFATEMFLAGIATGQRQKESMAREQWLDIEHRERVREYQEQRRQENAFEAANPGRIKEERGEL